MKELVDVVMVMVKEVIMKLMVVMDDVYFFMKWIKPTFSQGLVLEMILHLKSFVRIKVFPFSTLKFCRLSLLYLLNKFSTVPF